MEETREGYTEYCKNFIIDHLSGYEGQFIYMCDLAHTITDGINVDGSATYSTYEAKEYIKNWWDEAADFYEYCKLEFGECPYNPFESPEAFHCLMVIEGVVYLLSQCDTVAGCNWNEKIELTEEIINAILEELAEVIVIEF